MFFGKKSGGSVENSTPDDDQLFDLVFDFGSGELQIKDDDPAEQEPDNAEPELFDVPEEADVPEVPSGGGEETGFSGNEDENEVDEAYAAETADSDSPEEAYIAEDVTQTDGSGEPPEEKEDLESYSRGWRARQSALYSESEEFAKETRQADSLVGDAAKSMETEEKEPQKADAENTDKVKSERLDALVSKKKAGGADRSAEKLGGIIGVSKDGERPGDKIGGMSFSVWTIIVLSVFTIDVFLLNYVAYKIVYPLVKKVMEAIGVEALKLDAGAAESLYSIISYAFSFIVCGLAVLIIAKFTESLLEQLGRKNSRTTITRILVLFMFVFVIIGLIVMIATHRGLFTLTAYRWFCPFLTYAGGLVFFLLSQVGKKNNR